MPWPRILVVLLIVAGFSASCFAVDPSDSWKSEGESGGVAIFSQLRPNSSLKKFKAVGEIEAPIRELGWGEIKLLDADGNVVK